MIPVGEKLGGRYFVLQPIDPSSLGVVHEVRDAQGTISYAQVLHAQPLQPVVFEALRGELGAIPASRLYRRPDEVVRSTQGVAVAVFRQAHPPALAERLAGLFTGGLDDRRRAALRSLVGWFAPLAEELNNLHAVGIVHGAITLDRLHLLDDRGSERLAVSGFGIEAAGRLSAAKPRPAPRADFAALALALQAAMERTGARPDGPAVVRWEMIRNCARAGDHPALQSGLALANAIRNLIDEPARRISGGNITAVGSATASPGAERLGTPSPGGSGPRDAMPSGPPSAQSGRLPLPFTPPPEGRPEGHGRRRRVAVAAVVVALTLVTAAAVTLSSSERRDLLLPGRVRVSVPTRCGDEPLAPPRSFSVPSMPRELFAACVGDTQQVLALSQLDDQIVVDRRRSARGSRFESPSTVVAEAVLQAGTALSGPVAWTTWLRREGAAFGLARIDQQVRRVPMSTPGLTAAAFRGALLLRADATGAWIGTTYVAEGRERAAIVEFPARTNDEPRLATVYLVAEGSVAAAVPGDPATLLLRATGESGPSYAVVSLPLNTLAGLSTAVGADGGAPADAGTGESTPVRELPAQLLQRSAAWRAPAGAVSFVPLGIGSAGSSRRFLATVAAGDAGCANGDCQGAVTVVEFPPNGEVMTREIERQGRGVMISGGVGGTVIAAATRARDGELVPYVLDAGSGVRPQRWVLGGLDAAGVVACGDEPWMVFAQGAPLLKVGAVPLACALR